MKRLASYISIILMVLSFSACTVDSTDVTDQVANIVQSADEHVLGVKNGTNFAYPGITYGEAFDSFFGSPTWKYFEGSREDELETHDVVEFTGYCLYQDVEVKVRIQFTLSIIDDSFEATFLAMNEVPQNALILTALIDKAFTEYGNGIEAETFDSETDNSGVLEESDAIVQPSATTDSQAPTPYPIASDYFIQNYDSLWSFETIEEFMEFKYGDLGSVGVNREEHPQYGYSVSPYIVLDSDNSWSENDYDYILWDMLYATALIEYGVDRVDWLYGYASASITDRTHTTYYKDNLDCIMYTAMD